MNRRFQFTPAVKLVNQEIIPPLVEIFYPSGDGSILENQLQNELTYGGGELTAFSVEALLELLAQEEADEKVRGLSLFLNFIQINKGEEDLRTILRFGFANWSRDFHHDPIINFQSQIAPEIYHNHARFVAIHTIFGIVMLTLGHCLRAMPLENPIFRAEILADIVKPITITHKEISSYGDMIQETLVKFEDLKR